MKTTRKPKALIDAEAKIASLEAQLAQQKTYTKTYQDLHQADEAIINGIHDLLTDLGIREFRDENKYVKIPLPVRLFGWAMSMAAKSAQVSVEKR